MKVKCCGCGKEYSLGDNIFEYDKDTNCPILICPYCNLKHAINFMPLRSDIKAKKVKKLELGDPALVILGASRIANASRIDQSGSDNRDVKDGIAWDISTLAYAHKSVTVTSQDAFPVDIAFSSDGTKMYMLGDAYAKVFQYTLTTAWDISTASYANKSKLISAQDTQPRGLAFSSDGSKMYMNGASGSVYQYTLTTAWDVSTASYSGKSKLLTDEGLGPYGITFKPDGFIMYMVDITGDFIFQYTLTTAWDVSTAGYSGKSFDAGTQDDQPKNVAFSSDGFQMYVLGLTSATVYQYTLTTAWDVSTAEYASKFIVVKTQELWPDGIAFSSDGTKMYMTGDYSEKVHQYNLISSWTKTDDFILATRIYTSKGPIARAYKLLWRNVTDEGVFADVAATGEISYAAVTDLTDDGDVLSGEKICDVQTDYTWQNGLESEGDNRSPDADTYSLADEYYTELQWALDCSNALDEHEYEFELWDVTEGFSIGTCLASITMAAAAVEGFKWNTKTIIKWCGKVISKWNIKVGS